MASTKRVDRDLVEHLAREVKRIVDADFGGVQRAAEKRLRISQSHLSQLIRGEHGARGPGLQVLLKLREYSGKSIDELLGLPPLKSETEQPSSVEDRIAQLEERLARVESGAPVENPADRKE